MERLREKLFTEKLLESLPGIFFLYDSTCHLKRWNKAHETAMGFTADELRDWYIPNWHETPEDAAIGMALVKSVLETGIGGAFETTLINKDGRFVPYLISITRLLTPDGPAMMGVGSTSPSASGLRWRWKNPNDNSETSSTFFPMQPL